MKYILAFLFLISISCSAQINLTPSTENIDAGKFIGSVIEFKSYKFDNATINVLINSNESGSANSEGTDEVTYNLYITKCESGELIDCQLLSYKNKYLLEIIKVEQVKSGYAITVRYGSYKNKKQEVLIIRK